MTGGSVTSSGTYTQYTGTITNYGNLYIEGGNIESTNGIAIYNIKTTKLGKDDSNVSITSPTISGSTYGIQNINVNSKIYFYDGIIKGEFKPIKGDYGEPITIPDNYEIVYSQESTVATLRIKGDVEAKATIGTVHYKTLKMAVESANTGDIITLIFNDQLDDSITIPEGLEITIDLNGYTIQSGGNTIINNGNLTLKNSGVAGAKVQSISGTAIQNNGTLTIQSGEISGKTSIGGNGTVNAVEGKQVRNKQENGYQTTYVE